LRQVCGCTRWNCHRWRRRQITWFKRSKDIRWLRLDDAYTYIAQLLASMSK
jgi:tRNA A37 N6-isopentenylltransferase MiaA